MTKRKQLRGRVASLVAGLSTANHLNARKIFRRSWRVESCKTRLFVVAVRGIKRRFVGWKAVNI